jgi:hypothetical protein
VPNRVSGLVLARLQAEKIARRPFRPENRRSASRGRHGLVVGRQRLGPHEHHRIVVDVDDARIGVAVPGDLVRVGAD